LPVQAQTLLERHLGPLPEALQTCAGQAQALHLAPGQVLLGAGQRWERLWLVQQGCLRLYYLDREGRASNKNFFLPGSLLWPITPALREQSAAFFVEAVSASRVWAWPWADWIHAAEGHPPWLHLQQHTLAALLQDKMERERQFLQLTATERYQRLCQTHPEWLDVLPLRHLASWLGITDVALSRIRRRLGY
jgi:CRP-like cAMP-binding protein